MADVQDYIMAQQHQRSPSRAESIANSFCAPVPNGRKLKRKLEREEKLAAQGVLPRSERLLQAQLRNKRPRCKPEANNNPGRGFYDIWEEDSLEPSPGEPASWHSQLAQSADQERPSEASQQTECQTFTAASHRGPESWRLLQPNV
ncbi:Ribosome biogenesis NOP53 [Pelobates cultripes]|uniref:Ribosome biogenesis NOP53 n=1 Tax=Pelobates cultripes TaxID=61616 RepID=A0AAD1WMS5_PELCU|nr:Ribosome biogenesis NOP53 [Pelobates cultripes]